MVTDKDGTPLENPSTIIPFIPSHLPKDPMTDRIAELEQKLSETLAELGHALNSVHQMRRWLLQIRTISGNVNFDVV